MNLSEQANLNRWLWPWIILSIVFLFLAPSKQSLWIDEALVARVAMDSGDVSGWWRMTWKDPSAERFKPGHTFSAFTLSYVFGTSEYEFRLANIVWGVMAVAGLALLGLRLGAAWLPLAFAVHPFVWLYMDELRPYAMQLAGSCWMLAALVFVTGSGATGHSRAVWTNIFWAASFICYSANMLGALSIASCLLVAAGLYLWRRRWPEREIWAWSAPWIILHAVLSVYFAYRMLTLESSAGAILWPLTPANIGYALYELLGFIGFGPGRDKIREVAKSDGVIGILPLMMPYATSLGSFAAISFIALVGIIKSWLANTNRQLIYVFSSVAAINILLMFAGAYCAGWPFWGRHLAPALPFILCLSALGYAAFPRISKVLVSIWIAMMLAGSIHMRFTSLHAKDDYRAASSYALSVLATNKTVWWAAESIAANYYFLFPIDIKSAFLHTKSLPTAPTRWPKPPIAGSALGKAILTVNQSSENLASLPPPDVIILSKVDIFDDSGSLQKWIKDHGYIATKTFPAFTVWENKE